MASFLCPHCSAFFCIKFLYFLHHDSASVFNGSVNSEATKEEFDYKVSVQQSLTTPVLILGYDLIVTWMASK